MSLLAELDNLQQQRRKHLDEVAKIDAELERARLALGLPNALGPREPKASERHRGVYRSVTAPTAVLILDALAQKEPQSINVLMATTGVRNRHGLSTMCHSLEQQGRLFSRRVTGIGRPSIYARTHAALQTNDDTPPSDDELGQSEGRTIAASADGISAGTITSQTVPDSSGPTAGSVSTPLTNNPNGSLAAGNKLSGWSEVSS